MPLMETATAIVHVVGIVLMSDSIKTDGRLHAIVPRIAPANTAYTAKPADDVVAMGVEEHIALIAYRDMDREETASNWPAKPFGTLEGWSYIVLDGERLTAGTDRPRTIATRPRGVAGLPRISRCCSRATLKPGFLPPFKHAAAVMTFAKGRTRTETCYAKPTAGSPRPRTDTLVEVENDGLFVIQAGTRKLALQGYAEVYLAHIPPRRLPGTSLLAAARHTASEHTGQLGIAHSAVFDAMVDRRGCGDEVKPCAEVTPTRGPCDAELRPPGRRPRGGVDPVRNDFVPPPEPQFIIDYQCSNSQWP